MSMKSTKLFFETKFHDAWTTTPIHYSGQEFKATTSEPWISLTVNHTTIVNTFEHFTVNVVVWSMNELTTFEIADSVIDFIKLISSNTKYLLGSTEVLESGWTDQNASYLIIQVQFKTWSSC